MLITMLKTRRGTEDGKAMKRYYRGRKYDLADTLARTFINAGAAYCSEPGEERRQYTYHRDSDGCDETWDVCDPNGQHIVSIPLGYDPRPAEAKAQMIVEAFNSQQELLDALTGLMDAIDGLPITIMKGPFYDAMHKAQKAITELTGKPA